MLTRIAVATLAAAAVALSALPAAAQTPTPPVPTLPNVPTLDTERFAVTVQGDQAEHLRFDFDAVDGLDCSLEGRGTLDESWDYARGKDVVIVFKKLAPGVVVVQRAGRGLGDSAFAVTGTLLRDASGSVATRAPIDCTSFPLHTPACERGFQVRSDVNLRWRSGKLVLGAASTANTQPNPALGCGSNQVWNFDVFSFRFPGLAQQKGPLPMKKLFKSKKNLKVELKDRFLEAAETPPGYNALSEDVIGSTTITLKRLKH